MYYVGLECPFGRWGVNCENECHCRDHTEVCHPLNGTCDSGCDAHWTGTACQRKPLEPDARYVNFSSTKGSRILLKLIFFPFECTFNELLC